MNDDKKKGGHYERMKKNLLLRFAKNKSSKKIGAAVIAVLLVVAVIMGLMPNEVLAAKESDLDTSTKYTESLGNDASTEYSGRIWTDKSVYSDDAAFNLYGGGTAEIQNDSDFLVAYSALATGMEVKGLQTAPLDVVFVIDMSGSMRNNEMDDGRTRLANTIDALNESIESLLATSDNTRIAVVTFSETATTLLPLDHYTKYNNEAFFSLNKSESYLYTNAVGTEQGRVSKTTQTTSGTNIQKGIFEGMNILATENETTATINGVQVQRVPSVILLSDGAPTIASKYETWWNIASDDSKQGYDSEKARYGMLAIMTASYMKDAIDRNYGVAGTANKTTVYSIGMGIKDVGGNAEDLAYVTINPAAHIDANNNMSKAIKGAWQTYTSNNNTGTPTLNNYTFKHPTTGYDVTDINYVDQYYDADKADEVTSVFESIVSSISIKSAEVPTEIKGSDPMTDGYITYTDPIGEYMEVKDVEAILYAGYKFEQKEKVVSDDNLTTTYTFSGEVHSAIYGDQNINNIIIVVTKDAATGNETITIKIPASVIPVRVNAIELNEDGSVKSNTSNGAYPVRVLYTVGLQDGIIDADGIVQIKQDDDDTGVDQAYVEANTNTDGTVNFYSNLYTGENVVNGSTAGNTTVEFEPSHTNSFYYMQTDTALYSDESCTQKVSAVNDLDDETTYYYPETYYYGTTVTTEIVARTGAQLKRTDLKSIDGCWYRAAGSPRVNRILEFEGTKAANSTNTAEDFYAPTFVYADGSTNPYDGKFVVYLGNNGVLNAPATGSLVISKTVTVPDGYTPATDSFKFTVDFNGDNTLEGNYAYEAVDAEGTVQSTGTIADGGTISLKDGWTATIKNLPPGTTYEVTEAQTAGFTSENDGDTSGTITAGGISTEAFTNTYAIKDDGYTTAVFRGKKVLTGREWNADDTYTFQLKPYDAENPMPDVTEITITEADLEDDGTVLFSFGEIRYTKPGVYKYTIEEKDPATEDAYLPGVSYSQAIYEAIVTVTDNGDGTLSKTLVMSRLVDDSGASAIGDTDIIQGTIISDKIAVFTNTYNAESVEWGAVATKKYTDNSGQKPLTDGMFTFKITALNGAPMPANTQTDKDGNAYVTAVNVGTQVYFPAITYTHDMVENAAGNKIEYQYELSEVMPEGAAAENNYTVNGMAYDPDKVIVTVTVSLEGNKVAVSAKYDDGSDSRARFTNEYTPKPVEAVLAGTKTLNGRDMMDGETFKFVLTAANDEAKKVLTESKEVTVAGGVNGKEKAFAFDGVEFTKPGTYVFNVTETAGTANGVTYDDHTSVVTVVVTDENGQLKADVVYDNGAASEATDKAVFVNTYESTFDTKTSVDLEGTKNLTGKSLVAGEFYFEVEDDTAGTKTLVTHTADDEAEDGVYSGSIKFLENVTYTEAGEYVYYIREQIPEEANQVTGTTYDESVYKFTVTVTDDNAGRLYVSSKALEIGETTDGVTVWKAAESVTFNNTYVPTPLSVHVSPMTKVLEGNRTAALKEGEFTFRMSLVSANPEDGITLPAAATVGNNADGSINFGNITFTKAGTYTVQVEEVIPNGITADADGNYVKDGITYTTQKITATYIVTDNRDGKLTAVIGSSSGGRTFTNTYEAEGSLDITIHKDFTGREGGVWLDTDKFYFEVVILDPTTQEAVNNGYIYFPTDGEEHIQTVEINAETTDHTVTSPEIKFYKAGEYKFIVREVTTDPIDGVNYDSVPREICVTVTDNNDGILSVRRTDSLDDVLTFVNKYVPSVTELSGHDYLKITKQFTGRENDEWLDTDQFVFTLTPANDDDCDMDSTTVTTTEQAVKAGIVELENKQETETLIVNNANKAYPHFGKITFKAAGRYTFYVTETEGNLPGVTYDTTPRSVVVDVTDNNKGELIAALNKTSAPLVFKNTYTATQCSASLEVTKELSGRDWFDTDEFTFTLEPIGDTANAIGTDVILPDTAVDGVITTSINGKDAMKSKAFGEIIFTKAGTYTFVIEETSGDIEGIAYDINDIIATVNVTDKDENGNPTGQLAATVTYSEDSLSFKNIYTPQTPAKATLSGTKVMTEGYDLKAGDFRFSISAAEGTPMPAQTTIINSANTHEDGSVTYDLISFGEIEYAEAGTYVYEIVETRGTKEGVTFDSGKVTATVVVNYDSATGTLNIAEGYPAYVKTGGNGGEGFTFVNTYKGTPADLAGATDLKVTKNFTGRTNNKWLSTDLFVFELAPYGEATSAAVAAGNVVMPTETTLEVTSTNKDNAYFGNITFKEAGTYTFAVTEAGSNIAGVTNDTDIDRIITVNVTDSMTGKLVVTKVVEGENASEELVFNNVYNTSGTTTLTVQKELTGRENDAWTENDVFTFALEAGDEKTAQAITDGKVILPDDASGITISSADDVKEKAFGAVTFTEEGSYQFVVKEVVPEGAVYNEESKTYTLNGITYDSDLDRIVKVSAADNNDGTMTVVLTEESEELKFTNTYSTSGTLQGEENIKVTKVLEGRNWLEGDSFTFTIVPNLEHEATKAAIDAGTIIMPENTTAVAADANGAYFENITFKQAGERFEFVVTENVPEGAVYNEESKTYTLNGVTYDNTSKTVVLTAVDNGNGTLTVTAVSDSQIVTFTNTYAAAAATAALTGEKQMSGRELKQGEFDFNIKPVSGTVKDENGNDVALEAADIPMPAQHTVSNGSAENVNVITFDPITYTKAGTYVYEIREVDENELGVTYAENVVTATVTVTEDAAAGTLSASVAYSEGGFVFANSYMEPETDPVDITALKTVTPSEGNAFVMNGGEFAFELIAAETNPVSDPLKDGVTATNNADGTVVFTPDGVKYTEAGTYVYTVNEVTGELNGIDYDSSVYTITVTVTPNTETGKLDVTKVITKDDEQVESITFNNGYNPCMATVVLGGKKILAGGHKLLYPGEFKFQITAVTEGAPMPAFTTVTNSATGIFVFDTIHYTQPGTYVYQISEVNEGKTGYTYSDAVYTVTVTVTDENSDGTLDVTVEGLEDVVFINEYVPNPVSADISGTKILEGRAQNVGEFTFQLVDRYGNVVGEAKNNADGTFTFSGITFDREGRYYYTVVEKDTKVNGVTYDLETVYGVEFIVTDIGHDGQLDVTVKYYLDGAETANIVFTNIYKPAPTSVQIGAVKILEGRDLEEGEFTFVLEDEEGNKIYAVNNEDGTVVFEEITYDEAGTYVYKVYEQKGTLENVTYDETVYTVTVVVEDDLDGHLVATVTIDGENLIFKNIYNEPEDPDTPDDPNKPEDPDTPDDPNKPDDPDTPDDPNKPDDPNTPDNPNKPGTPDEPNGPGSVDTGDHTNLIVWCALMIASAMGIAGVTTYRRRQR